MNLGLNNKTVLVTAASQGLGKAIAAQFVAEGARVYICSRNSQLLNQTAATIDAIAIPCDLTNADAIHHLLEHIGKVDVLVTNAGGPPPGQFTEIDDAAWQAAFALTFLSCVRLIRQVLPGMQQQHWGRIICLTSTSVKQPIENLVTSNALRAAVANLAKSVANEVAADGITVNCVAPGRFDTDRLQQLITARAEQSGYMFAEEKDLMQRTIPTKRFGMVAELAALVTFLASDQASYITGTLLPVDGGLTKTY
ncbi:MAG: SDR family oxidoreductase [Candidatus Kerfeldbacteria bacterium]|nr:SDR family oxidoreductase [Candidatus Kerfeldbacteria bacterium]